MTQSKSSQGGSLLSKEERRALLEQIERETGHGETPEQLLQRAEQALTRVHLEQARRLVERLEQTSPQLPGLAYLKERLEERERQVKQQAKLKATEEMLIRFIQERKKPLAEMALETLLELSPEHPRRSDYRVWVADLDKEVELQKRLDGELASGRAALAADDLERAKQHLEALRKVDPQAAGTEQLAEEISQVERGQAQSADIDRLKQQLQEHLESGQLADAEREIEQLRELDVPKITLDFLFKRLEEARERARGEVEMQRLISRFERHLEARDWQSARDVTKAFGERFKGSPRAAEMFNKVSRLEAEERRRQSVEQGIEALDRFIAQGHRREAELALKVLQGLDVDPALLARYEAQIQKL